jgi:hypothetical protein
MASLIKSVSLSVEECQFLESYQLSPTKLLREKIWEMKGMLKSLAANKIEKMAARIQQQADHIDFLENALEKEKSPQK